LPKRHQRSQRRILCNPCWQYTTQSAGSHLVATHISGQCEDTEGGDRRLLQPDHVIAQEAWRKGDNHLIRYLVRMAKSPHRDDAGAHHEQRGMLVKMLRGRRWTVRIEVGCPREQQPRSRSERPLDECRVASGSLCALIATSKFSPIMPTFRSVACATILTFG
jgi:hypothetical protein